MKYFLLKTTGISEKNLNIPTYFTPLHYKLGTSNQTGATEWSNQTLILFLLLLLLFLL